MLVLEHATRLRKLGGPAIVVRLEPGDRIPPRPGDPLVLADGEKLERVLPSGKLATGRRRWIVARVMWRALPHARMTAGESVVLVLLLADEHPPRIGVRLHDERIES